MRVAVAVEENNPEAYVSPRFGRCRGFLIFEGKNVRFVENPGAWEGRGAGIRAAQVLVREKVDAVVAGSFGPNAQALLSQAGIRMYVGMGKAREEAEKVMRGEGRGFAGGGMWRGWR